MLFDLADSSTRSSMCPMCCNDEFPGFRRRRSLWKSHMSSSLTESWMFQLWKDSEDPALFACLTTHRVSEVYEYERRVAPRSMSHIRTNGPLTPPSVQRLKISSRTRLKHCRIHHTLLSFLFFFPFVARACWEATAVSMVTLCK